MNYNLLADGQSESAMSFLDEDLSFLATQAALELDMLIEDKDCDLKAILLLSKVMNDNLEPFQSESQSSLLDSATATIVHWARSDAGFSRVKTVDQLIEKSLELARELASQVDPNQRNGELEKMKKFCIAFARCSSAYRETVLGHRSMHPYRK